MPDAGALKDRYSFQRRGEDENGDRLGPWAEVFSARAQTIFLRGGEGVLEQRMQGAQPVVLTIRTSALARQVTNAWRAVDARDETRVFDISAASPAKDPAFIDVLAVMKVEQADG